MFLEMFFGRKENCYIKKILKYRKHLLLKKNTISFLVQYCDRVTAAVGENLTVIQERYDSLCAKVSF